MNSPSSSFEVPITQDVILERIEIISSSLKINPQSILEKLPHLTSCTSPYVPRNHHNHPIKISQFIDHTLLKANATSSEVKTLCHEAIENNFYAVCVNGSRANLALELLKDSGVKVAVVVGFPLGASTASSKYHETTEVIELGVHEIDMVINIGCLIEGDYQAVMQDIRGVVDAANGKVVKVIMETALLTKEQLVDGCILAVMAGAAFVKTSTGFSTRGAKLEDILIMKGVVGDVAKVKASGGVKSYQDAIAMIEAGSSRIGTSAGIAIIKGNPSLSDY